VQSASPAVDFQFARTDEDYRKVLLLRQKAYTAAGKVSPGTALEELADIYDARARLVMGVFQDRVVCTCRLVYNEFEDRMEQEAYVDWPLDQPRRDDIVEIMRACTDPEFRGSDLLLMMFRFVALSVVQSKRRYIVLSATEDMRKLYDNIGFSYVGVSYPLEALNNTEHFVYIADVPKAMSGKNVHPLYWSFLWGDVSKHMLDQQYLKFDPFGSMRMAILRLIGPLGPLLRRFSRQPVKARRAS
jgi:predicted GNAT family N-acyltransferase